MNIVWFLRAAPMVFYKLALSILFYILIEEREVISLSRATLVRTFQDYVRMSRGVTHITSYVLRVNIIG